MSTETQNLTTTTTLPITETVTPTATAPDKTGGKTYTEAEVENIVKERLEREKLASDKKAKDAADKAAAEAAAKNGEWQKVAEQREKELKEAKSEIATRDLNDRKRAAAKKIGLPDEFALRLQGSTDEELESDAKHLLEAIPKQSTQDKTPGIINPTNPSTGSEQKETKEQALRRLGLR